MEKKELTAADVWAMFAETDRLFKESREEREKWQKEREEFDKRFWAMHKEIGGISNSNGDFAEEFFYNSLEKTMTFASIHFDVISNKFGGKKTMPDKTEIKAQFDIVLHNGNSLALIEAKYKANLKDVKELVEKKVPNFRLLYPEYAKYKLYLGIGSLVLKDRVVQEAKKRGIGLMKQHGDAVEYKTDWVRVY
jgi:hypothetical protein